MAEVKLRLELKDVYKKPLKETVDVVIKSMVFGDVVRIPFKPGMIDITGLIGGPQGRYRIDMDPASYQMVSSLAINLKASGITPFQFIFPVDPAKITSVKFPTYGQLHGDLQSLLERSDQVLGFEGQKGQGLYEALDDVRRAGLLNIAVKTQNTHYSNGRTALSYVQQITQMRGDRFFAVVPKEFRDETKHSVVEGLFKTADELLHKPPEGFIRDDSFKTHDHYGNLQLSFFSKGDEYAADIDIDDAGGFEHFFQVLKNFLSGKPTDPYNIHEILLGTQDLDPGYTFVL
ncbi:MAG TPA: hypothetical protein VGN86_16225 [Pyrinomonadaceae bacterium]|nr:hypothetical protein [Pyrinomonadaceae bacterium]